MNIQKAAALAQSSGTGMARHGWPGLVRTIIPTNHPVCCMLVSTKKDITPAVRWEPQLDDLIADDWYVPGITE